MTEFFKSREEDYRTWLEAHPTGFVVNLRHVPVVNLRRDPKKSYAVLHRADCRTIKEVFPSRDGLTKLGGFTERSYVKLCAETVSEARTALADLLARTDADFSKCCKKCNPA